MLLKKNKKKCGISWWVLQLYKEDYVRDMLVHGLSSLGGVHPHHHEQAHPHHQQKEHHQWRPRMQLTVVPRPPHLYEEEEDADGGDQGTSDGREGSRRRRSEITATSTYGRKGLLYGSGFTYSGWLPLDVGDDDDNNDDDDDDENNNDDDDGGEGEDRASGNDDIYDEDRGVGSGSSSSSTNSNSNSNNSLRSSILAHAFDLVVFGSVHRGLPFLPEVLSTYHRDDVVFVDGEDGHGWGQGGGFSGGWCASVAALWTHGHYFMREMPDGCPPSAP
jgi:hypothetical protein